MTFPDRVLTPEQIAQRASAVLVNLGDRIDFFGWECIKPDGRKAIKRLWKVLTLELADARERIEASK